MALTTGIKEQIIKAVRDSKKEVIGYEELKDDSHALTTLGIINTFGKNPCGFIYIEANIPRKSYKPADIILCDPDAGVIVIEVKGYPISCVDRIIAGTKLKVHTNNGITREITPWDQARTVMFDAQNEFAKKYYGVKVPCFTHVVAFPAITRGEMIRKFGKGCISEDDVLFKEDIEDTTRLWIKLTNKKIRHGASRDEAKPIEVESIDRVKAIFGDSSVLYRDREYRHVEELSLGRQLDDLEIMDKYLSKEQQDLSDLKIDGKPRLIRGVAGSGKTIVLANMVANYIKQLKRSGKQSELDFDGTMPKDISIAVVCYNKTLMHLIKEKISIAYKSITGEDLPWDESVFLKNFDGLLRDLIVKSGIIKSDIWEIGDPKKRSEYLGNKWEEYIAQSAKKLGSVRKFDAIFVDEGQDLSENEYVLLKDLLKPSKQGDENIIIFYDDAQNIYGRKRPNWSEVGINVTGARTGVMKTCFRNTRPVINLAYNVLLGSCAADEIKVNTRAYSDVNYLKKAGLVEDNGEWISVNFAERTGPRPVFNSFKNSDDEIAWVVENIKKLIEQEHVRCEDILIMARSHYYCDKLAEKLAGSVKGVEKLIKPYGKFEKNLYIFQKNALTVSTVHGAKGYDAGIVFLTGLHDFSAEKMQGYEEERKSIHEAECRAMFYVGATRAKYQLYLSGVKDNGKSLLNEIEKMHLMLMGKEAYKYESGKDLRD